jgi:hypothetical protein
MTLSTKQRREIQELVGIPFARGARGPEALDCLGLTLEGLALLRPDLELVDPWAELGAKWLTGWRPEAGDHFPAGFVPVTLNKIECGDVLLVGHKRGAFPSLTHLDLVLWGGLILRTRKKTGATIEPLSRILRRRGSEGPIGAMRPPAEELAP